MRRALILAVLALAGCGTTTPPTEQPTKTVYVDRQISASCVPGDMKAAPSSSIPTKASLLGLPDDAARYQALGVFWTAWSPWIVEQALPVLDNCRKAAPARP